MLLGAPVRWAGTKTKAEHGFTFPHLMEEMAQVFAPLPVDVEKDVGHLPIDEPPCGTADDESQNCSSRMRKERSRGGVDLSLGREEWARTNELSSSLPNLADGSDLLLKPHSPNTERLVRNSLSNIFDKHKQNGRDVINIFGNGDLSSTLLRAKALSAEDCPSSTQGEVPLDFDREKAQQQLLKLAQDNEFVVNVGQNNNRLSAVLENLPV